MKNARTGLSMKRLAAILFATVLAFGLFAVTACSSNNDEQTIRDGITKEFDNFKNPTKEKLEGYVNESTGEKMAQLEALGIDLYEFMGHALGKFDYQIGDIKIDGDKATVDLAVTNIDVATISNDVMSNIQSDPEIMKQVQDAAMSGGQTAAMQIVMDNLYNAFDSTTDTITTDTQITLTKNGSMWEVDEDSLSGVLTGIYGNIDL